MCVKVRRKQREQRRAVRRTSSKDVYVPGMCVLGGGGAEGTDRSKSNEGGAEGWMQKGRRMKPRNGVAWTMAGQVAKEIREGRAGILGGRGRASKGV